MQRGHKDKFKFYQQFVSVKLQSSIFGSLSNTSMRIWSAYGGEGWGLGVIFALCINISEYFIDSCEPVSLK